MSKRLIGIDIGGTKIAVSIADANGVPVEKIKFPTAVEQGPELALARIIEAVETLCLRHGASPELIGICCGSPLDPEKGIIQAPPNLSTWIDVPIVEKISTHFKVPSFLDNDANAAALAEYLYGAGKGTQHMIYLTYSTGMGCGMVLNGKIYRGKNCYAGEVGHIRLTPDGPEGYFKRGSFEGFCSGIGIAQLVTSDLPKVKSSILKPGSQAGEVVAAAEKGDELALRVLNISANQLGKGIAILVDILNPELIVLGSIFFRAEKFIRPEMERALAEEALPQALAVCKIVGAGLGEQVGDYAAISVAKYATFAP